MRDSYAARVQDVYDGGDDVLDTLARREHRTVVHWWGRRIEGAEARAVCYICDAYIAKWSALNAPTKTAIRKVQQHRSEHLSALSHPALTIGGKA